MSEDTGQPGSAEIVQTARDTEDRLTPKGALPFADARDLPGDVIEIRAREAHQRILGFGGAFTEAGAHVLSRLSPAKREEVLNAYFDPENGSRYSLCRTHINSCDFSLGNYAYSNTCCDFDLHEFDISHDKELLIPFIKDALQISRNGFKLLASPWSPPAWMKTVRDMNGGGKLKKDCFPTWALYFSKYIRAYAREGIPVWGVTVQNEPVGAHPYDACEYTAEEERDFIKYYLGPRLAADGLCHVKIIAHDHNKDVLARRAEIILSDPAAAAFIWGTGVHWYRGDHFDQVARLHKAFPAKHILGTEACVEGAVRLGRWDQGERYAHDIIGDLNNGAAGWVDWNMVLDTQGGPNHAHNYCDAPIIADPETDTLHYQSGYYYLAHFSRFIRPGARRLAVRSSTRKLESTACRNRDGSKTMVVLNRKDSEQVVYVKDGTRAAKVTLPAHAIVTLTW